MEHSYRYTYFLVSVTHIANIGLIWSPRITCLPRQREYLHFLNNNSSDNYSAWSLHFVESLVCFVNIHSSSSRASYQIRKIAGCACAWDAGNVFFRHRLHRKPLVSDPGMHHGTCAMHLLWCMSRSLYRGGGETSPAFPVHAQPAILRIWQEAHGIFLYIIFEK